MSVLSCDPAPLPVALAQTLWSEFGLVAEAVEQVVGGFDPAAKLWRITDSDGFGWAVKATQRDCRYGLALASSIAAAGSSGVVAPRLTHTRTPWSHTEKFLVSVSRWIDGDDAAITGLTTKQWSELGTILRNVHGHRPPESVFPVRRGIKRSGQAGRARLRRLDRRFDAFPPPRGERVALETQDLADLWREHRPRLSLLDARARKLKASRTPAARVPCHGDPHLGNVLLDEDGHPWLIDLDEATTAHREVDLLLIELGVLPSSPVEPSHREAFWCGYGSLEIDESRLIRFGCIRALEDVTSVFGSLLLASPDAADSVVLRTTLDDLLGPRGLIAIVEERGDG